MTHWLPLLPVLLFLAVLALRSKRYDCGRVYCDQRRNRWHYHQGERRTWTVGTR